jgi:RHS repeat-associated protein
VQLLDEFGDYVTVWTGDVSSGGDFLVEFEETTDDIKGVRIFVEPGNSIDAVKLLTGGTETATIVRSNATDGYGTAVTTLYDDEGRIDTVTTYRFGVLTQVEEYTYTEDYVSAILTTDALDRETYVTYDESGRKLTETFAYGTGGASTTTFDYDEDGNLISLIDPKGNETEWVYDGNTVTMTDPLNQSEVKTYNNAGQLISILSRNGLLRTFEYDEEGRLETETWYDGPTDGDAVVDTFEWTYNAQGLVETASNDAGSYEYAYDDAGRVIHVSQPFGVSQTFAYDGWGRRILSFDSLGGREESIYDAFGNLVRRELTQGSETIRIDQTFDAYGRVLTQTRYWLDATVYELVSTSAYVYNAKGQLLSITHEDATPGAISSFVYTYDAAGQIATQTDSQEAIDSGTPWVRTYTYDDQGQLTDDDDAIDDLDYDLGGNRDEAGHTYTRNYADTADTNQLASDGVWDYTYDAAGNMTMKSKGYFQETWVYGYDHANQLISARKLSEHPEPMGTPVLLMEAEYKYDVYGNRVEKSVDADGAGVGAAVLTRFAIDGWNPTKPSPIGNENYDVFADLDYTNSLTTRYLRGDSVDQLLARIDGSDPRWHLTDHLGSVRDIIDNTGTPLDSLRYDSFGNIDTGTELDDEYRGRYAFTGREFDVETQLQYNRARYYDATTGRWISQDPMGFDAGDSNLYRYVSNRPGAAKDPSGKVLLVQNDAGLTGDVEKELNSAGLGKFRKIPTPDFKYYQYDVSQIGKNDPAILKAAYGKSLGILELNGLDAAGLKSQTVHIRIIKDEYGPKNENFKNRIEVQPGNYLNLLTPWGNVETTLGHGCISLCIARNPHVPVGSSYTRIAAVGGRFFESFETALKYQKTLGKSSALLQFACDTYDHTPKATGFEGEVSGAGIVVGKDGFDWRTLIFQKTEAGYIPYWESMSTSPHYGGVVTLNRAPTGPRDLLYIVVPKASRGYVNGYASDSWGVDPQYPKQPRKTVITFLDGQPTG